MASLSEIFSEIVKGIVSQKDQVKITEESQNGLEKVKISVAKEDMGPMIGKGGRVIKSMRRLSGVLGVKRGKKIIVELEEDFVA